MSRKTILLVEDEVITARYESQLLAKHGYSVITATNGEEALQISATRNDLDLILMDIDLGPGISGTEAARHILAEHDLPLVFLSSHTEPEIVDLTEGISSYGYIVKNSGETVLLASIRMAFRLFEARQREQQQQRELFESEQRFRQIYEHMEVGVARVELDMRISTANPAYCRILSYSCHELKGKHLSEITHPEVLEENLTKQRQLGRGEIDHYRIEKKFIHHDGHTVYGILDANLVRDHDGTPLYFLGSVLDISDRKKSEEQLQQQKQLHRLILDTTNDGYWLLDSNGRIIETNEAYARMSGYTIAELTSMSVPDLDPWEKPEVTLARIQRIMTTGHERFEARHRRKDGSAFDIEITVTRVDHNDSLMVCFGRDISQRKKQLAELELRNREMSALLEAAGHVLTMSDFKTTARTLFDIARELTGATSGYVALLNEEGNENEVLFLEAGGMPCSVDPSLPMPIRGLRAESYASGKAVACNDFMHSEWVKMMPHGHVTLRNVMFAPLNIDGITVGLMGLANKQGDFNDDDLHITTALGQFTAIALRNARYRENLAASEAMYRLVFENAPIGIFHFDPHWNITLCNDRFVSIIGSSREQLTGLDMHQLPNEKLKELVNHCLDGRAMIYEDEYHSLTGNKSSYLRVFFEPILSTEGSITGGMGIVEDVSEARADHEALLESRAFLSRLLEAMPAPVFYKDARGCYVGVNEAFEEFFGKSRNELIGKTVYDINPRELADIYHARDIELLDHPGTQIYESKILDARGVTHHVVFHKSTFEDAKRATAGIISVVLDISERVLLEDRTKKLLEEKSTLLKEAHHRI